MAVGGRSLALVVVSFTVDFTTVASHLFSNEWQLLQTLQPDLFFGRDKMIL